MDGLGMFKLDRISGVARIGSYLDTPRIKLIVDGSETEFVTEACDEPILNAIVSALKSLLLDPRPFVVEEPAENPATENAAEPEPCDATADEAAKR